jgi:hypothetical protein
VLVLAAEIWRWHCQSRPCRVLDLLNEIIGDRFRLAIARSALRTKLAFWDP